MAQDPDGFGHVYRIAVHMPGSGCVGYGGFAYSHSLDKDVSLYKSGEDVDAYECACDRVAGVDYGDVEQSVAYRSSGRYVGVVAVLRGIAYRNYECLDLHLMTAGGYGVMLRGITYVFSNSGTDVGGEAASLHVGEVV